MSAALKRPSCVVFLAICLQSILHAQWSANGIPVCDTSVNSGFYMLPQIASDGNGGAIVCWRDARNGTDYDIYGQHIAPDGTLLWPKNGLPIVAAPRNQQFPRMLSDGNGGAFVAWEDDRLSTNTFIYAQHINGRGESLWQGGGVKVAEKSGLFISMARDDRGGLLLGWNGPTDNGVVVQRLESAGSRIWGDSGVQVSTRPGNVYPNDVAICNDGNGGLFVVWSQGAFMQEVIYLQHVDSSGTVLLAADGIPLSDAGYNFGVSITPDLHAGAIVGWASNDTLEYVQRVNLLGGNLWGTTGIVLGKVGGGGGPQRQTPDGHGGAYIGHWKYIQHIDTGGNELWGGNGVQFINASTLFYNSAQALNAFSGIWNFCTYDVGGATGDTLYIYGQYIDSVGNIQWGPMGKPIATGANIRDDALATSDGYGNAIVVWDDFRKGYCMVMAAKVDSKGVVTEIEVRNPRELDHAQLEQNFPNPFNPETTIHFSLPRRSYIYLAVYTILGQEVRVLLDETKAAGRYSVRFSAQTLSSGIYFYRLTAEGYSLTRAMVLLR